MAKRFIDTSILPKKFRKLTPSLKLTWYYLWTECDKAGVYEIDEDLFEFENGFEFPKEEFLKELGNLVEISGEKILIKDFIRIDSGNLKEGYNPHKPTFRAIAKNNIKLNPSLNQAYFKQVEGDVDGEEDVDEGEDGDNAESDQIKKMDIWPNFDDFWETYDKKIDKTKSEARWNKLNRSDKEAIMNHLYSYIPATPDVQYRKNPSTYLNNKTWEDEDLPKLNSNGKDISQELKRAAIALKD